ncbi:unnamed protein product [Didymodactylos carnosus]|uniref:Uncharacterized protein n=1 Tax=Didymodactylos carnosus TaxID=1234261 RepID=A0A814WPC6_9BILA|nr:unnamed protein product [Didymodactylos carnosus]CAF3968289.1 unnamed protein product [Didymodactylos carnosus]
MLNSVGNYRHSELSTKSLLPLCPSTYPGTFPCTRLFLAKYRQYPCKIVLVSDNEVQHVQTVISHLCQQLNYQEKLDNDLIARCYHSCSKTYFTRQRLLDSGNGLTVTLKDIRWTTDSDNPHQYKADYSDDHFLVCDCIEIFYLPEHDEEARILVTNISKMTLYKSKSTILHMICKTKQDRYYLRNITIKKPLITDMSLNYGQQFVPVHEKIIKNLNKKDGKGIVLLHGIPGSGKTHYIRYLIHEIKDKTLIYVPLGYSFST